MAASLHELAGVLRAQGDLPGARANLERVLEIHATVFGTEEHPDVATSLHELAGVLHAQGDLPGARANLERALEIHAAVFGTEEHPSVAASLHATGRACSRPKAICPAPGPTSNAPSKLRHGSTARVTITQLLSLR